MTVELFGGDGKDSPLAKRFLRPTMVGIGHIGTDGKRTPVITFTMCECQSEDCAAAFGLIVDAEHAHELGSMLMRAAEICGFKPVCSS